MIRPCSCTTSSTEHAADISRLKKALNKFHSNVPLSDRVAPISESAVCRYVNGETHTRGRSETRGAKGKLANRDKRLLRNARTRLIKKFDSEYRVTYKMIIDEAAERGGLQSDPCQRVVEDFFRSEENVRYRKPREKIYITEKDAAKRMDKGLKWKRFPAAFWSQKVAYLDNKKFPLPLTPAQRRRIRCNRITGHLRKPCEGVQQGFTKPREKHSFIGSPSVNIAAAVSKNRVIMWEVLEGTWNGQAAADLYKGPLLKSLKRTFPDEKTFLLVEDGDTKGYELDLVMYGLVFDISPIRHTRISRCNETT